MVINEKGSETTCGRGYEIGLIIAKLGHVVFDLALNIFVLAVWLFLAYIAIENYPPLSYPPLQRVCPKLVTLRRERLPDLITRVFAGFRHVGFPGFDVSAKNKGLVRAPFA